MGEKKPFTVYVQSKIPRRVMRSWISLLQLDRPGPDWDHTVGVHLHKECQCVNVHKRQNLLIPPVLLHCYGYKRAIWMCVSSWVQQVFGSCGCLLTAVYSGSSKMQRQQHNIAQSRWVNMNKEKKLLELHRECLFLKSWSSVNSTGG